MPRPAKETRDNFEAGKCSAWSAGAHGRKVRVYARGGKLWMRFKRPDGRRTPVEVFAADTPALRQKAAASAAKIAERLRSGQQQDTERAEKGADELTIFDVVLLYMRRAPGFPAELFDPKGRGVKRAVEDWYAQLPESVRKDATVPKAKTLWTDVYGFLRLFRDPRFARTRKVMSLDPADGTNYAKETAAGGGSPRTPVNDVDRLSCAIRYVQTQYRRTYGIPYNPLEGRKVDRTRAEVPEFSDEELRKLYVAARQGEPGPGQWQVQAAVRIASSGRRIGSILALTAADHDLEANTVTWRAAEAKGEGYGRGDETMPMTALHREAVEWLLAEHPNPLGAEHPLLWMRGDPERHVAETTIDQQFRRLEKAAGVKHRPRRAFHGFCRSTITTLADRFNDGVAAEFAGRTPETIRRYSYKKKAEATMKKAAGALGAAASKKTDTEGFSDE
ncbi:MAG TPA: site-specific integrase [Longimicrobiaceae bacterium]|nr:site-specific integrase [Longimicrobiaceae bacterium]